MDPFEAFQPQAVASIVQDFKQNPTGRFLLVVPTGGGKTFTAMRAIGQLFASGTLKHGTDRVVWVAHHNELLVQARAALSTHNARFPGAKFLPQSDIKFTMIGSARDSIIDPTTKLVVFDEAHHGAAPTYYKAVFTQDHAGILGLTATPTRYDGEPLDFERESYSIGFPDLIKLKVLINPEIRKIQGLKLNSILSLASEEDLEQLNTAERDAKIIRALESGQSEYQKVIVYAATARHAKALYDRMRKSKLPSLYESIAWVLGNGNSRDEDRDKFFQKEKKRKRSILINVGLLNEGYDDPTVNTVVMAAPCRSKLYYMQAVGRAVRLDPANPTKRTFVLEVADTLPNIRYKIDNRWLFSDISDAMEPAVEDYTYSDAASFTSLLTQLKAEFAVDLPSDLFGKWNPEERYSILFFKRYAGSGEYRHMAIPITKATRLAIHNAFNYLSQKLPGCVRGEISPEQARQFGPIPGTPIVGEPSTFAVIYQAMQNQQKTISGQASADFVKAGYPWITFTSLRFWCDESSIPQDLLDFLHPCVNRQELINELQAKSYSPGSHVVRLPLPLQGVIGRILPAEEVSAIRTVIESLRSATQLADYSQAEAAFLALSKAPIPLETRMHCSLLHIVRDNYEWQKEIR